MLSLIPRWLMFLKWSPWNMTAKNYKINLVVIRGMGFNRSDPHMYPHTYPTEVPEKVCHVRDEKPSYVGWCYDVEQKGLFPVPQSPHINWLFCSVGQRFLKTFLLRPTSPKIILPNIEGEKKVLLGNSIIFSDEGTRHILCHKTKVIPLAFSIIRGVPIIYKFY